MTISNSDVVQSIGWLDRFNGDITFDTIDWSSVDEDATIYLNGRKGKLLIDVDMKITNITVSEDWDDEWDEDYEEDDD